MIKAILLLIIVFLNKSHITVEKIPAILSSECTQLKYNPDEKPYSPTEFGIKGLTFIDQGAHGKVFAMESQNIIKRIRMYDDVFMKGIEPELNVLISAKGSYNILSIEHGGCFFYHGEKTSDTTIESLRIYLIMKRMFGGDLFTLLKKRKPYTRQIMWKIDMMIKVTKSVQKLHNLGFIHRDLKTENILILEAADKFVYTPVLSDFDTCIETSQNDHRDVGTIIYHPPEAFSYPAIVPSYDVYSLGVLFFFMLNYERALSIGKIDITERCEGNFLKVLDANYCIFFEPMIRQMLSEDPSKRQSIDLVLRDLRIARENVNKNIRDLRIFFRNAIENGKVMWDSGEEHVVEEADKQKYINSYNNLGATYQEYLIELHTQIDIFHEENDPIYQDFLEEHGETWRSLQANSVKHEMII